MRRLVSIMRLFISLMSLHGVTFGWGCSGHEIVAIIADRQFSDVAAQKVYDVPNNRLALYHWTQLRH
jgi:hypothetical protein